MAMRQTPLTCPGHTRPIPQLQYSGLAQDGSYLLISACLDGDAMLRVGKTGDWIGTFKGHKGAVWSAKLNQTRNLALTGSADFTAKLWDVNTGTEYKTLAHKHIVKAVHIGNDNVLLTGGNEKVLRLFDINQLDKPQEFQGHKGSIRSIATVDRTLILTASEDKEIRLWDSRAPKLVDTIELADAVTDIDYIPSKESVVAACKKGVYFYSYSQGKLQAEQVFDRTHLGFDAESVSIHPTLPRFIVGGSDFNVHVFDSLSGRELEMYKIHHGPVHSVRYSPDGEIYASGSDDGTIRLWQTSPGKRYGLWLGTQAGEGFS